MAPSIKHLKPYKLRNPTVARIQYERSICQKLFWNLDSRNKLIQILFSLKLNIEIEITYSVNRQTESLNHLNSKYRPQFCVLYF